MKNKRIHWLIMFWLGCPLALGLIGCHSIMAATHFNYSVTVINETSEAIFADGFKIFEKEPYNLVDAGFVIPKASKSTLSFRYAPTNAVTIKWKSKTTEKTGQATVKLQLPKEFTKKNGAGIYFYIQQDQTVRVAYRIRDSKGDSKMME